MSDSTQPQTPRDLDSQNVAVLPVGTWGAVLASLLARKGHHVVGWDRPEVIDMLRADRSHPRLEGFRVPAELRLTADLGEALGDPAPDCVVVTMPSAGMRSLIEQLEDLEPPGPRIPPWVVCSKAIDHETQLPMGELIKQLRPQAWQGPLAVLSGPSHAEEVAQEKPTTVCVASDDHVLRQYVQSLFMTDRFRVYTQDDVLGVQLGGALKNVIAIAAGVCDGLELGDNSRAALITRGLAEMIRLGVAMGAKAETFAGLTGMGDLIVTCASTHSRNHWFGELLAKGYSTDDALAEIGMAVEGVATVRSVDALARRHGVEMPISRQVYEAIYEGKSPIQAVDDLMRRDARPEKD